METFKSEIEKEVLNGKMLKNKTCTMKEDMVSACEPHLKTKDRKWLLKPYGLLNYYIQVVLGKTIYFTYH